MVFFRQKYLAPVLNLFNSDKACIKTRFYEQRPENEDPYFQNNMPTLKRAWSPTSLTRPEFVKNRENR